MRERETVKVGGEGCDHVVTEMYGMIALLKQKGQNFQSHMQHSEVFPRFFSDFYVKAGGFWIKSGFSGRQPRDTLF